MTVIIANVLPDDGSETYGWHRGFAAMNTHLFPRSRGHYLDLVDNYQVVAASEDGDYIGFCYYSQDDGTREYEVGGLMVASGQRGRGLGGILMSVSLGNLLIDIDPLHNGEGVISHVIKGNDAPRSIITKLLRFAHRTEVKIPGHVLPGLQTEADGMVHGDEFEMIVPETLIALAEWCDSWPESLSDGTDAEIRLRESLTLADWAEGFREMVDEHS